MTATAPIALVRPGGLAFLWDRRLDRYPTGGERYARLVLVVPYVVHSATTLVNAAPYVAAAKKAQASGRPVSGDLAGHLAAIQQASVSIMGEWQVWMGIAIACAVFLALTVPFLRGPWSPAKARAEQEEHSRRRDAAIAELRAR